MEYVAVFGIYSGCDKLVGVAYDLVTARHLIEYADMTGAIGVSLHEQPFGVSGEMTFHDAKMACDAIVWPSFHKAR